MSVSPSPSTSSSFSSVSSSSSNYDTRSVSKAMPLPKIRLTRPTHKRAISDFTPHQRQKKIRKTSYRNKNIILWPSQLHSLGMASKQAKQRANTQPMSRASSTQPNTSIQEDPVMVDYMQLLQKQQKQYLALLPTSSQETSRQSTPGS